MDNSEFKKIRRQLQRKRYIKIDLCVRVSDLRLFNVGHVVPNRRSPISFTYHECFRVKAKNERFSVAGSCCRQNLKCENFTSLFGRLREKIAPKSVPYGQHDYYSSFNQSNH